MKNKIEAEKLNEELLAMLERLLDGVLRLPEIPATLCALDIEHARAGRQDLNDLTLDEHEMRRDARAIRDRTERRVRFYQFGSRFFRRHRERLTHLLADRSE